MDIKSLNSSKRSEHMLNISLDDNRPGHFGLGASAESRVANFPVTEAQIFENIPVRLG
jgi:hypothetical protein